MGIDFQAIRKHADEKREKLFEHLDRNRSLYADVNREFYQLGVAGWTREAEDIADSDLYDEDNRMLTTMPMVCMAKGSAGFNSNLTPPASPWFRLKVSAASLDGASHRVKAALDKVTELTREAMSRSNCYKALAKLYDHLLVNGFALMIVTRDSRRAFSVRTVRPGTYALGIGGDGMVNRAVRRFAWTCEQIVREFGDKGVGERVLRHYDDPRRLFTVYNLIEPNGESRHDKIAAATGLDPSMAYRSIYWLKDSSASDPQSGVLEISGFHVKPIIAPRFDYENGDTYGTSPCIKALALARGAQTFRYDALNISGMRSCPPLVVSAEFKDEGFDAARGGVNYARFGDQQRSMAMPVFAQLPDAADARLSLAEAVDELKTMLFVTAFQTIDSLKMNKGVKTATEIDALVRENMEALGPVVMNLDRELLDPLVSAVVSYLLDSDSLPLTPEEREILDGSEIEYISQIHVAARQSTVAAIRDNAQMIINLSQAYPDARHRLDVDGTIDLYADITGCPAGIFADEASVKAARDADRQLAERERSMAAAQAAAQAAAKAGSIPTDTQHAGSRLMEALGATA